MKTKTITVHYCDHCRARKFTRPAMIKHETGCTANPNRVCQMCIMAGLAQKPIAELIATLEGSTWGIQGGGYEHPIQKEKELREAAGNCPACILATLRQHKFDEVSISIDWKAESKAWLDEFGKAADMREAGYC